MLSRSLPLVLAFALVACGEKEPTTTAAPAEAASTKSDKVPSDPSSEKFGEKLFKLEITSFRPIDGGGASLIYDRLTFAPDGTWTATGSVTAADEKMECVETGDWTMDPAEDEDTASMTWTINKTNCAGREPQGQPRRHQRCAGAAHRAPHRGPGGPTGLVHPR